VTIAHPHGGTEGLLTTAWLLILGILIGMLVMQRIARAVRKTDELIEETEDE
jgi:uncharacterized membrane-anchored protein YhcB (DUF1043 family)